MSALMIAGIEIHQDHDGRFSLNDFHKAAGSENRHKPSLWTENQQAQELIEEIGKAGINSCFEDCPWRSVAWNLRLQRAGVCLCHVGQPYVQLACDPLI